jgi:nitroimidazol reductase NimA-like FMN-containing flavoprotein (pyridoxamine 5'-phosphate oxidase superfamily)
METIMAIRQPTFFDLPHADAVALVRRNDVGRLAFSFHDRVEIEPLSYVLDANWIYGRTSPGTKFSMIGHSRWVAFQVDEVEDRFNWRSVVVHGALYVLGADGGTRDDDDYAHGLDVVRTLDSEAFTPADPTPYRTQLFRVHIDDIAGRAATTRQRDATESASLR